MMYNAYARVPEEFPTFEAAVEHLQEYPGSENREPVAVLLLTESNSQGVVAEEVDGVSADPIENQVYLVTVAHEVMGKKFTIEYIVEFGLIPEEEEIGEVGEDGSEPGPGDEAGVEQPDESTGEGGEEPVEDDSTLPGDNPEDSSINPEPDSAE